MIFPISLTALKYKKPNARKGITTTISAKVLATVLRYKKPNARKGFFTRQMDNGDGYAKRNCPEVIVRNPAVASNSIHLGDSSAGGVTVPLWDISVS